MMVSSYSGKRVLITGHTGFKGSWLSHWLNACGAQVSGLALAPETQPNLFDELGLAQHIDHRICDLRDRDALARHVAAIQPEIVFHLAAQALVRRSYQNPVETFATNVMGTAHLLESCFATSSVRAIVVVTSDKCYAPSSSAWGYRECDPLGGHDPYSASKACEEWVATAWQKSFGGKADAPLIATTRAGNVIGGGDWAEDRLIPDLVRARHARQSAHIRNPNAVRPWQHVLEPLAGYLQLGERLLTGDDKYACAWNFGPEIGAMRPVADLCAALCPALGLDWQIDTTTEHPHEAEFLRLDSSRARQLLDWQPRWSFDETMLLTGQWYDRHAAGETAWDLCNEQLQKYRNSNG